jgi:predicted glutamine amidotransferase
MIIESTRIGARWNLRTRLSSVRLAAFMAVVAVMLIWTSQWAPSGLPAGLSPIAGAASATAYAEGGHNCRFWSCTSAGITAKVIRDHLVDLSNSIENLSESNPDGWSIGYFASGRDAPVIHRGELAAHLDSLFDAAVEDAEEAGPQIALSHIRSCSSGLCDIPNPHPFHREMGRRHWLMGHNGTIAKSILLELIRPEYLRAHPPQHGADSDEWIDSELYFIYMLQTMQDFRWEIKSALGTVIQQLRDDIPGDGEELNFFLTDGKQVWGYREGRSLYVFHATSLPPFTAMASQYPQPEQGQWTEVANGQLITMTPGEFPRIEEIEDYFGAAFVTSPDGETAIAHVNLEVSRDPSLPIAVIRYDLPFPVTISLQVYDSSGGWVRSLMSRETEGAGKYQLPWNGKDDSGQRVAPGVYYVCLQAGPITTTERIVLLK